MNDKSLDLTNYSELKFSREQSFFDKSMTIRFFIGLVFLSALFLFLHFREVRVEVLELNSIAPNYVVAQIDFDFLDEEATIILRQEAVRDIDKIYKLSGKDVRFQLKDFENFLMSEEGRKSAEKVSFEELYSGASSLEKLMLNMRLSDPRTIQKIKEAHQPITQYQVYTPANLSDKITLPVQIWEHLFDKALPPTLYKKESIDFARDYFKNKTWSIEEDIPAQRQLRRMIQSLVPEKYTNVSAGSRIIDQGEKVTARHIAMMQAMKDVLSEKRNLWQPLTLAGSFIFAFLLTSICAAYLYSNHKQILFSNRKLGLIVTIVVITLAISKITEFFLLSSKSNLIEVVRYPLFVPFAAILMCSLVNTTIAAFTTGFLTLVLTVGLAFERQGFMLTNLIVACFVILSTRVMRRRQEIFVVCMKAWLCCILVIFALHFSQNEFWNTGVLTDISSAALFMFLTAVLAVGVLPLLESTFRVLTDITLMEYMDPNSDLLRRLTIQAPGTYQHSIVVGNIAETMAMAIGANGLFCRVATLYHDIGKMATPQYFTENQEGGVNIHQLLTPIESAEVIIAHIAEGVSLARKADLPEQFIDIIKEHHGTSLVYYFYRKELERMNGDKSLVHEADFRYSGPTPRSKESAIIMIADTVEAASRSLDKIDEASIMELATRLIREKWEDGQFDQCLLTTEELSTIKYSLVKTLVAFGHSRVKYPLREQRKAAFTE